MYVSRYVKNKNIEFLLNLFNETKLNDIHLVMVCGGLPKKIKIKFMNNSNITIFDEIINPVTINKLFYCCDLFVYPSSIGLSLNQALYWGLPAIVGDTRNHGPEITYLRHQKNGWLIPIKEQLFIKRILKLHNDKKLLKRMSNFAKKSIITSADIEKMVKGFLNCTKSLN